MLAHNDAYFNIRLIAKDGNELVVGVKSKGSVIIQSEAALQNKGNRAYFKEAIALKGEQFYISKIDLNREHGALSFPYIPTIRVAKPIYIENKLFGLLIINVNIYKLFSVLESSATDKKIYLANEKGYYLYNEDKEKTFGFELGTAYKIGDDFDVARRRYFKIISRLWRWILPLVINEKLWWQ